jgi:hypothetical protein
VALQSPDIVVRTPDAVTFREQLARSGIAAAITDTGLVTASGASAARVGRVISDNAVEVYEMRPVTSSLEDVFLSLINDERTAP